jgi:hypothetical protein
MVQEPRRAGDNRAGVSALAQSYAAMQPCSHDGNKYTYILWNIASVLQSADTLK